MYDMTILYILKYIFFTRPFHVPHPLYGCDLTAEFPWFPRLSPDFTWNSMVPTGVVIPSLIINGYSDCHRSPPMFSIHIQPHPAPVLFNPACANDTPDGSLMFACTYTLHPSHASVRLLITGGDVSAGGGGIGVSVGGIGVSVAGSVQYPFTPTDIVRVSLLLSSATTFRLYVWL